MAEAQYVVNSEGTSPTTDPPEIRSNLPSDSDVIGENIDTNSPISSQLIRSSSNILNRIKTITFGRLKKQYNSASPKAISPTSEETSAAVGDFQSSADLMMTSGQGGEKSPSSSKSYRRRKILSHLCTSTSAESESESSIGSIVGNTPLEANERSSPPLTLSASPVSRPAYPSNQLVTTDAHQTLEFKPNPQSSRPNESLCSIEPNISNSHRQETPQFVSSVAVIRSPGLSEFAGRPLEESVVPCPYLNLLNEPSIPSVPAAMPPPSTAPSTRVANRALPNRIHTQIDFIHCFVPDFLEITNFPFYWGKMDQYEADKLLENKPHGTFLLRDSAQEDHLFSVSFCRFQRSCHARIQQSNNGVSFNTLDPGVYSSSTVKGLIEHYKDPENWMFWEPMLILPLHRPFPFSLKHLSRATICSLTTYDSVSHLPLPQPLKNYLQEYHFKKKVAERHFDSNVS